MILWKLQFWRAVFSATPQPALAAEASALSLADPLPVTPSLLWSWGFILWSPPLSPEGTSGEQIQSSPAEHQALQFTSLISVCSGFVFCSLGTPREADLAEEPAQNKELPSQATCGISNSVKVMC